MRRTGVFALSELPVVAATIAVLVVVLHPSLGNVKNPGRRMQCGYRIKEMGRAYNLCRESNRGNLPTPEQDIATGKWIQHYPWSSSSGRHRRAA